MRRSTQVPVFEAPHGATLMLYLDGIVIGTVHVERLGLSSLLEVEQHTGHVGHPGRCLATGKLAEQVAHG